MCKGKYFITRKIFEATLLMLLFPSLQAEELCYPGGTQVFSWTYHSSESRIKTNWYFSDIIIMIKKDDGTIDVNPDTPFAGRIWEDNKTNCGMILRDVHVNDTGLFSVFVDLFPEEYTNASNLTVSEDAAEDEVIRYREIWIDGTNYVVPDNNFLGAAPLTMTLNLTQACIPAPDITIYLNSTNVTWCYSNYICEKEVHEAANVTFTVNIETTTVHIPPVGQQPFIIIEEPTTTESSPLTTTEDAAEESCRKNIKCIVPATVVPIGCVLIAIITALLIIKPCRE